MATNNRDAELVRRVIRLAQGNGYSVKAEYDLNGQPRLMVWWVNPATRMDEVVVPYCAPFAALRMLRARTARYAC